MRYLSHGIRCAFEIELHTEQALIRYVLAVGNEKEVLIRVVESLVESKDRAWSSG